MQLGRAVEAYNNLLGAIKPLRKLMLLNKNQVKKLLLLLVTTFFCLLITEIVMRIFLKDRYILVEDERNLNYRYDSILGWFPIENTKKTFKGSHLIDVENNSRGFRDDEHLVSTNPRIVFLGDSYVWGYDVNSPERFTEKLDTALPNWSIYNLGVSGYGTDQEYLLLQQHYDFYMPNIVFLIFAWNDDADNTRNRRYWGYYKPYFVYNGKDLELRGTPVPKSENYFFVNHNVLKQSYLVRAFIRLYFRFTNPPFLKVESPTYEIINNIHELSKNKGFQFVIGLQNENFELELFLTDKKIPYVSLSNNYTYPSHGKHWTPEGHTFVANRIYEFLKDGNYLINEATPKKAN